MIHRGDDLMKIEKQPLSYENYKKVLKELIQGKTPKLAPKQVDQVEEVSGSPVRKNHRIQYTYNKELEKNVAHVVDNNTGEVVKKRLSDAEVDRRIRVKKGIHKKLGEVFDRKF